MKYDPLIKDCLTQNISGAHKHCYLNKRNLNTAHTITQGEPYTITNIFRVIYYLVKIIIIVYQFGVQRTKYRLRIMAPMLFMKKLYF